MVDLSRVTEAAPFSLPEELLRVASVQLSPLEAILDDLERSADGASPVLYIHGFLIDFEKGCRRATTFQENALLTDRLLWFTWPSDGDMLNYTVDEADLYWSVFHLAEVFSAMQDRFGAGEVDVAGHSLGARGVVLALHELMVMRPDARLGHVALLAPDVDTEIFERLLPRIRPIVESITIYVADDDRPLQLSEQLHGYARLGQAESNLDRLEGVEVVDVSGLETRSPSGHLYHLRSKAVGKDLSELFREDRAATDRSGVRQVGRNRWLLEGED